MSFLDENKFCNRVIHTFCFDVELTFCSFLSKFTYSKNLKTGTIHLKFYLFCFIMKYNPNLNDSFDFVDDNEFIT